jgi:lipoprotein-anchoring transpeptidase ErfK/SrfK
MKTIFKWTVAAAGAALLASCSTTPRHIAVAPAPPVPQQLPYQWTHGNAPQAHKDAVALFGPVALKPGEYKWAADIPADGETKVIVDRLTQLFYVYRGDKLVGVATASTGKKGKETPLGFWKVFRKQKLGYSRKYDNAPMPFMQMYDPKGIAFHAGPNPGYPASHGCVRLPKAFAEKLFTLTKVGTEVIIEG